MGLKNRLASVERIMNPVPPEPQEVLVRGGMLENETGVLQGWIGKSVLYRNDDESERDFRSRALGEARAQKAKAFVLGGLPEMPE